MKKASTAASFAALAGMMMAAPAMGADIPKGNHYVCYPIKDVAFKTREAAFKDQFGTVKGTIVRPVQLCAPADKMIGKLTYQAPDPKLHMVCYEVKLESKKTPPVQTTDQFGTLKFQGFPATIVCLPAAKVVIKQ
jgi:hypothetical protein